MDDAVHAREASGHLGVEGAVAAVGGEDVDGRTGSLDAAAELVETVPGHADHRQPLARERGHGHGRHDAGELRHVAP